MRLQEFLLGDQGPPAEPHGSNWHMDVSYPDQCVADLEPVPRGEQPAYLDGRGVRFFSKHDLPHRGHDTTTYDEREAIRFRHFLGESEGPPYVSKVTGASYPSAAIRDRLEKLALLAREKKKLKRKIKRRVREDEPEDTTDLIDEILKGGKNEHGAYDLRTIKKLEGDGLPGRSADGEGFCFHWADGRGVCGFKYKNDALRWLKAEPRDVVRFWHGEPVMANGKFRFKVRERYRADEAHVARVVAQLFEGSIDFEELLSDPETRRGWIDNIAMSIHDTKRAKGESAHDWRNRCAERFLDILGLPTSESLDEAPATTTTDHYKLDAHDGRSGFKLYEVDASKWDAAWRRSAPSEHVGPQGSGGIGRRYTQFSEWLRGEPLQLGRRSKPGRAADEKIIAPTGYVAEGTRGLRVEFENGRHRFAYMRDSGERTVVALTPQMAALARQEGLVKREVRESA